MELKYFIALLISMSWLQSSRPEDIIALEGENVTLTCNTPSSEVFAQWLVNETNAAIRMGSVFQSYDTNPSNLMFQRNSSSTFNLYITNVSLADEGKYACNVRDEPTTYYLKVNTPASVTVSPNVTHLDVLRGHSVHLQCTGAGKPTPNITWTKVGDPKAIEAPEGHLNIDSVDFSHGGQYSCTANNGVGEPDVAVLTVSVRQAPLVEVAEPIIMKGLTESISLNCTFRASPHTNVLWQFHGHNLYNGTKLIKTTQIETPSNEVETTVSMLKIDSIQVTDYGTYTCLGTNDWGKVQGDISLFGFPPVITELKAGGEAEYIDQYRVRWMVYSDTTVTSYHLTLVSDSGSRNITLAANDVTDCSNRIAVAMTCATYTLTDLQRNSSYSLELTAENMAAVSGDSVKFSFSTAVEGDIAPFESSDVSDLFDVSRSSSFSHNLALFISLIFFRFLM